MMTCDGKDNTKKPVGTYFHCDSFKECEWVF